MAKSSISSESQKQLGASYEDINTFYKKFQPRELARMDDGFAQNDDYNYRGAAIRALSDVNLGPNVVAAGALPNMRAGAAEMMARQGALVGGTSADAQLGQQQKYSTALKRIVQAGSAKRKMADYGIESNRNMSATVEAAYGQARDINRGTNAALLGSLASFGMGYLAQPSAKLVAGAKSALSANLANAATPGYAEMFNTTPEALRMQAIDRFVSTPVTNAARIGGSFSSWWNSSSNPISGMIRGSAAAE